ncbi:MAG: putative Ig domain-containing protein [Fibrobacterota bacterium]
MHKNSVYSIILVSLLLNLGIFNQNIIAQETGTHRLFGWEEGDGVVLDTSGGWNAPAGYGGTIRYINSVEASEGSQSSCFSPDSNSWFESGLIRKSYDYDCFYRYSKLIRTSGWHPILLGRDWSGYSKLWVDVKSTVAAATIEIQIEDNMTPSPLSMGRKYNITPGQWVTLEYDLASAEQAKLLDLSKIASMYVLVTWAQTHTKVYFDNVRLASAEATPQFQLVQSSNTWQSLPEPKSYNHGHASRPTPWEPSMTPDRSAIPGTETPVTISNVGSSRSMAAFDNNIIGSILSPNMSVSTHGGTSWSSLSVPTSSHSHHNGYAAAPGEVLGVYLLACSGGASPSYTYFYRSYFDGTQWKQGPYDQPWKDTISAGTITHRAAIIDCEVRHCQQDKMSLVRLPSGRIWAAWDHYNRYGTSTVDLHAKFSDDNGMTWQSAGATGTVGTLNYSGGTIKLTSLGYEDAAIFWTYNSTWYWSRCHQNVLDSMFAAYKTQEPTNKIPWERFMTKAAWSAPAALGGTFECATSTLDGRLFVSLSSPSKIMMWSAGTGWQTSLDAHHGMLTRCGENTVLLFENGNYQYISGNGGWSAAQSVPYWTSTAALSVPEISPPNFVPLAWNGQLFRMGLPDDVPVTQNIFIAGNLPDGTVDQTYSARVYAQFGAYPYRWEITAGGLPVGLSMDSNGIISGMANTIGTYAFTVRCRDANSNEASKAVSITIGESKGAGIQRGSMITAQPLFVIGNVPNPFSGNTEIRYRLERSGKVRLVIYNTQGRIVTTLVQGRKDPGEYRLFWNGNKCAPGVYFLRLETLNCNQIKKIVVSR